MSAPVDLSGQIAALLSSLPEAIPALSPIPKLPDSVASIIDHTLLAPQSTSSAVEKVAQDAQNLGAASVCVNSSMVSTAARALGTAQSSFVVCSVVGFPFGAANTHSKAEETRQAVSDGAREIDMVQNVGWVKDGRWQDAWQDVNAVVAAAQGVPVK